MAESLGIRFYFMELSKEIEIWVPINGWEDYYEVSSFGRIRSLDRKGKFGQNTYLKYQKGKIFNRNPKKDYYIRVRLCKHGLGVSRQLHIIVAEHFIANPENKKTVNHIDGNKHNNVWWNLEWNTYDENNKHAKRIGLNKNIGETHHWAILTERHVLEIFNSDLSTIELSKLYNIHKGVVTSIKRGQTWGHITKKKYKKTQKRLTEHEVKEIYLSKQSGPQLAKIYGVTKEAINYIKSGISYKNITCLLKKDKVY